MSVIYVPQTETKKKGPIRAVIYDRHSTEMQDTTTAESRQNACREYVTKHNMHMVRIYADYAQTGTSTLNRREYQKLLRDAHSPNRDFDVVLVYHSSRWGRSYENVIDEYMLNKIGIRIIWVSQPGTDADTPEVELMRGMIRQMDIYYSRRLGIYTFDMQSQNTKRGFNNGGKIPDGYKHTEIHTGIFNKRGEERIKVKLDLDPNPGRYDLVNEERWKWIRQAVDMALKQHKGLKTIAQELHAMGWRQKNKNAALGPSHVRAAFVNPKYTGYAVWNRRKWHKDINGNRRYKMNPPEEWIWSPQPSHSPVYSREEFEELNHLYGVIPNKTRLRKQLFGPPKCSICGSHFVINSRKKNGKIYCYLICGKKQRLGWNACPMEPVPLELFSSVLTEVFLKRILTEYEVKQFIKAFNTWLADGQKRNEPRIREIVREISKLDGELSNLKKAVALGKLKFEYLAGEINQREKLRKKLAQEKLALQEPVRHEKLKYDASQISHWLGMLKNLFYSLSLDQKRCMTQHYIKEIEIYPHKKCRIIYDPAAILTFRAYRDFPEAETFHMRGSSTNQLGRNAEAGVRIKGSCGGGI